MSSSLILCNNSKPSLDWIMTCHDKWFYITASDNQLSGWTEKLQSTSQSQTCTKNNHGHCLALCYLSDPLQLSESWRNHYIWEVCSANWKDTPKTATLAASIGQQKELYSFPWQRLTACRTTNASKLNQLGNDVLPHLPYSPGFLLTDYYYFKHLSNFLQGKCFHNQQEAENAFQEFLESWNTNFLCYRNKTTYFLLAKICRL